MAYISENSVKKVALGFLKTYYRFRPRASETRASIDMRTQSGIIADGLFTFQKENGQAFLATFEATAHDSREEVFYQLQKTLLWWDSVAVSSIITAFLFSFSQRYEAYTPHQIGLFPIFLGLAICLMGFAYLYRWGFSWLRKYRYIYAIEQFKHYHADEQWVAISDDVFRLPLEIDHLEELKNQCVVNGFGLVSIDRELQPHLLITPSREELFKGQRRITTFFETGSKRLGLTNERVTGWWNKLLQGLGIQTRTTRGDSQSLLRYQRSYFHQVILCLIASGVLAGVFYNQWQKKPVTYVDEAVYVPYMDSVGKTLHPDIQMEKTVDEFDTSDYEGLAPVEEVVSSEDIPETEESSPSNTVEEVSRATSNGEIFISNEDRSMASYDCERFYNFTGTIYLVQENTYALLGDAQQKMNLLAQKGISAGMIWLGCFSESDDNYVIYYDLLFDSKTEATSQLQLFRRQLKRHNLNDDNVQLRSISHLAQ